MWTGNVQRTERNQGRLDIIITYDNGTSSFNEIISTDKAQYDTWLSEQIQARLNQLNALDEFEKTVNASEIVTAPALSIDPTTADLISAVAPDPATASIDTQIQ